MAPQSQRDQPRLSREGNRLGRRLLETQGASVSAVRRECWASQASASDVLGQLPPEPGDIQPDPRTQEHGRPWLTWARLCDLDTRTDPHNEIHGWRVTGLTRLGQAKLALDFWRVPHQTRVYGTRPFLRWVWAQGSSSDTHSSSSKMSLIPSAFTLKGVSQAPGN